MSGKLSKDRASLCTFTFSDGRQCKLPRHVKDPDLCYFHARRERQRLAAEDAGRFVAEGISTDFVSACALSGTLGRLFRAVARGDVSPKTAHTLGYLAQIMAQTIPMANDEFSGTFGFGRWQSTVTNAFGRLNPRFLKRLESESEPGDDPAPSAPASPDNPPPEAPDTKPS